MKRVMKKFLICMLVLVLLNNFIMSNMTFAANTDSFEEALTNILGTVVGILTWPVRIIGLAIGVALDTLSAGIAFSQGKVDDNGNFSTNGTPHSITPFDILFNKVALVDINFFNTNTGSSIIDNIRGSIAAWYYIMRNIAAAILLVILIYVGIRMAITTIASDKAMYKKMLFDWVTSLVLIFLIQLIAIFVLNVNDAFIKGLSNVSKGEDITNAMNTIRNEALGVSINAITATIVYCMLVGQTFALFLTYFSRMLKLAFLLIISPLITLTYSIDKMGDGKAQALGTWLKEFIFTVLIQPFHCIIYMSFIQMSLSLLGTADTSKTIAGAVLAVLCIRFVKEGEKIVQKIFHFEDATTGASLDVGLAGSVMALSQAKNLGKVARKSVSGFKNFTSNARDNIRDLQINTMALSAVMSGKKDGNGNKLTYEQAKDDAETQIAFDMANKLENKNRKKYNVTSDQSKIDARTQKYISQGMSASSARAHARADVARELRKEKSDEKHKYITSARGKIANVKKFARESQVVQQLIKTGKGAISAGAGLAVGSTLYGVNDCKNALTESIMAGLAVKHASDEFFASSTKTLTVNSSNILQGAGMKNEEEARTFINDTIDNSANLENFNAYLDSIMDSINGALNQLSDSDKSKTKNAIKAVVQKEVLKNPTATNDQIFNKVLNNSTVSHYINLGNVNTNGQFKDTVNEALMATRQKELYNNIKQAEEFGLSRSTIIKDITRDYSIMALAGSVASTNNQNRRTQNTNGSNANGSSSTGANNSNSNTNSSNPSGANNGNLNTNSLNSSGANNGNSNTNSSNSSGANNSSNTTTTKSEIDLDKINKDIDKTLNQKQISRQVRKDLENKYKKILKDRLEELQKDYDSKLSELEKEFNNAKGNISNELSKEKLEMTIELKNIQKQSDDILKTYEKINATKAQNMKSNFKKFNDNSMKRLNNIIDNK